MPRAIAPDVTTTTSTPDACSAATSSQIRADDRQPQRAGVLGDDRRPELDDRDRHVRRVQLEDRVADLDVVARREARALQRGDHAHALQPPLDVRLRLLVLEVPAQEQALDRPRR